MGVFTAEQAKRGEAVFGARCAKCHEGADVDGPPITGDPFLDRWREDRLDGLFNFIDENMPQDAPGKLQPKEYVDVLAYVLSQNQIPSGNQELTADAIPSLLLIGRDGPKPLPAKALVKAAGCLTQEAGRGWSLSNAADLARVRAANEITPAEVSAALNKPLGTQVFELPNLAEVSAFQADSHRGHKVLIKGVFARRGIAARINVLAAQSVAVDCAP